MTNPQTNELIVFGTVNDYRMAQKIAAKFDVPPRMVSFRVNHTTPKEMAELVCSSLFSTSPSSSKVKDDGGYGGFMTGGAAELGGGSDSSSGGGGLTRGTTLSDSISLGEGVVACSVKSDVTASGLVSLEGNSLSITYFPQKGTISITGGSEAQAQMVREFIQANDKKQPQAYVEMQIVELSETGSKDFSNEWTLLTPFFAGTFNGDSGIRNFDNTRTFFTGHPYSVITTSSGDSGDSSTTTTYYRYHGPKTVAWAVNYLINSGKGRLLANPKVMVTNGKLSKIDLTSDYVKSTDEEIITTSSGVGSAGVSRTYEIGDDAGISVEMTPFISPDGYVTLNLKPHYATIKEEKYSPSSTGQGTITAATLLQRRDLELSNIRIKDGETLVLGGLIQEEERKTISKIPLLGDLPVIGGAFRSTQTKNEKSELVIMLTPRIIKDTEDVASDTENL